MAASTSECRVTSSAFNDDLLRLTHYEKFQTWANHNYGESSKTKTVTRNKYARIMRLISGQEVASSDNAKLRFWIKSKGFQVRAVPCNVYGINVEYALFVPTKVQVRAS